MGGQVLTSEGKIRSCRKSFTNKRRSFIFPDERGYWNSREKFTPNSVTNSRKNWGETVFASGTLSRLDEDTYDAITGYNERAWWNFRAFDGAFLQDLSSSDDTLHELKTLTLPTLLLHGKEDALVPLSFSHVMHRLLPHAELIEIDRCGHSSMLERPEVVNRLIGGFLANLIIR